jgi:hypothetical protein
VTHTLRERFGKNRFLIRVLYFSQLVTCLDKLIDASSGSNAEQQGKGHRS